MKKLLLIGMAMFSAGCVSVGQPKVFAYPRIEPFQIVRIEKAQDVYTACRGSNWIACFDPAPRVIYVRADSPWAITHELCHATYGDYDHKAECGPDGLMDWWK